MAEQNQERPRTEEKSAAQIERDIDRTRAEIDTTLDRIFNRLTPGELFEQTIDYVRSSHGFARFGAVVRDNPVPVVLAIVGIGWLAFAGMRARPETAARVGAPLPPPRYADRTVPTPEEQREESIAGGEESGVAEEEVPARSIAGGTAVEREEGPVASPAPRTVDTESEPARPPRVERPS